jgi:hypothetical protein
MDAEISEKLALLERSIQTLGVDVKRNTLVLEQILALASEPSGESGETLAVLAKVLSTVAESNRILKHVAKPSSSPAGARPKPQE